MSLTNYFEKNIKPYADHIEELLKGRGDSAIMSQSGCLVFDNGEALHTADCSCDEEYENERDY